MNTAEQEAWARLMARATKPRRKPTRPQIESALSTLLWLSEECDSGELRDQIAVVRHELHGILEARAQAPRGEVGTGAGEGAPGQDTGSAWVTRSTDCPEAPAQARLPAPVASEGSWICGRCHRSPEHHAASECVYDPAFIAAHTPPIGSR